MKNKRYIPFGQPCFSNDEINAVARVLRSGWIGMGPETISFEKELAEFVGAPYVVAVNSCTSALFLSLLAQGVGPGDEIICPSLTWCSTANVALYLGAKPVFCDIDPETLCMTAKHITDKITSKTKAVIVVHFGGLAVNIEALRAALPEKIIIIEDAAHAMGAQFSKGKPVGSSGNLTCYSFYANKNLSTGDGGAIALFDEEMKEKLCSLRQHGLPNNAWKRFTHRQSLSAGETLFLGYKMNYTDLLACIGRIQLRRQEEFHKKRLAITKLYFSKMRNLGLNCQKHCLNDEHSRHLFVVMLPLETMKISREDFIMRLRDKNIGVTIHYSPLHKMPLYGSEANNTVLTNTEYITSRIITLPISASIDEKDACNVLEMFEKTINWSRR